MAWKLLAGKVTIFPAFLPSAIAPSADVLFRSAFHVEPMNIQRQQNPLGLSIAGGRHNELMLQCAAQASRVDFTISGASHALDTPSLATIENVEGFRNILLDLIGTRESGSVATRVAVFLQFFSESETVADANRILVDCIPKRFGLRLAEEEDVVFQANMAYTSSVRPGTKINALTKWSVDRIQVISLGMPADSTLPAGPQAFMPTSSTRQYLGATVTLDYNNAPTDSQLSGADQVALLSEGLRRALAAKTELGIEVIGLDA